MRKVFLVFVDASDTTQNNKYYNMEELSGDQFKVEYGRIGSTKTELFYPMSKWRSTYNSKVKKGYKDITDLKTAQAVVSTTSGNSHFDEFYDVFKKYTGEQVRRNYVIDSCTPQQILEAQSILNNIVVLNDKEQINKFLLELYKVIPRRMGNVRDYLITDIAQKSPRIAVEQNAIDSMDSSNITQVQNPFLNLGIEFEEIKSKEIEDFIYSTMSGRNLKVYKIFRILKPELKARYDEWLSKQENQKTQLLIHGTRNPNIFSILKSGLLIRPTNAAVISGAAYGEGTYFSHHTAKSLGYTGSDPDKIFILHDVHVGKQYTYKGWYREGKDISRSEMNYRDLKKRGCDSLYVEAGDGLLNSEYIVYNTEQYFYNYLIWMK